jgi:predicted metal-dependent phosphoesterase TrpH
MTTKAQDEPPHVQRSTACSIDMHVHTTFGSTDSSLTTDELVEVSRTAAIGGFVVTEHGQQWQPHQVRRVADASGLFACGAAEWACEYGHVLVLGVDPMTRYAGPIETMRTIVQSQGGFMIFAHPFRYFPGPMSLLFGRWKNAERRTPSELAEHPAFAFIDEIEVLNNGCTDHENDLALAVAHALGMQGTGGSDAHSAAEVGRCVTVFQEPLSTPGDLLQQLRSGRFHAARQAADGRLLHVSTSLPRRGPV